MITPHDEFMSLGTRLFDWEAPLLDPRPRNGELITEVEEAALGSEREAESQAERIWRRLTKDQSQP